MRKERSGIRRSGTRWGGRLQSIDLKPITDIILYNTIYGESFLPFASLPLIVKQKVIRGTLQNEGATKNVGKLNLKDITQHLFTLNKIITLKISSSS